MRDYQTEYAESMKDPWQAINDRRVALDWDIRKLRMEITEREKQLSVMVITLETLTKWVKANLPL